MNLLAIETSTSLCSVALQTPSGVLVREDDGQAQKASDVLLAMISAVLAEAGLDKTALSAVACGIGPGAFTGLRTACAVAQGIAFGLDIPAIGVTSMQALAEQAYTKQGAEQVVAMMDARMNEVYAQALKREPSGEWLAAKPISVNPVAELSWDEIQGGGWLAIGNAWHSKELGQALIAATPSNLAAPRLASLPHARDVAALASRLLSKQGHNGLEMSAIHLEPLYVRDQVALTTAQRLEAARLKRAELAL